MDLIKKLCDTLGFEHIEKIEPVHEELVSGTPKAPAQLFAQAAIPAVLIALYKHSASDEGALNIKSVERNTTPQLLFQDNYAKIVSEIAAYSGVPETLVEENLPKVIDASVKEVEALASENTDEVLDVKEILAAEKTNALTYLPPQIGLGEVLNDNTIDDNVNKMEGPVSSLLKSIGNVFNKPDNDETIGHEI